MRLKFPTARGPDVAFVTAERFRAVVHAKVADYLAAGARLVWVVDSETESVALRRSLLSPRVLPREETLDAGDVLPGFRAKVARILEV